MRIPLSFGYFGHHKCASSWVWNILREVSKSAGLNHEVVHNSHMFDNDLPSFIRNSKVDFLSYTNADIKHLNSVDLFRGFHVIRDPRDIVVSAYFSHKYSHPTEQAKELILLRKSLNEASLRDGLLIEIDFLEHIFEHIYSWDYHQENVMEVRMEDLTRDPYEKFMNIFSFLGLNGGEGTGGLKLWLKNIAVDVNTLVRSKNTRVHKKLLAKDLLHCVYDNRFSKKSGGRGKGDENIKSHYRKGVPGDWVNYFEDAHKNHFKERYPNLLTKLEYEQNHNW